MDTFFIPGMPNFPKYDNPLYRELSDIINKEMLRPFHIRNAEIREISGEKELFLSGDYMTFDELKIAVDFWGRYQDPENATGASSFMLSEYNSFSDFRIDAELMSPTEKQSDIFSRINFEFCPDFKEGMLTIYPDKDRKYLACPDPDPALRKIWNIGRKVLVYDYSNTEYFFDSMQKAFLEFTRTFNSLGIYDYETHYSFRDRYARPMTGKVIEINKNQDLLFSWYADISAKATNPFRKQEVLKKDALLLPSQDKMHEIIIDYILLHGGWDEISKYASTKISIEWTLIKELNNVRNRAYEARSRNVFKKSPLILDEGSDTKFRMLEKFEYILMLLQADTIPADNNEFYDVGYFFEFEDSLKKARKQVKNDDPGYVPTYLLSEERPCIYEQGGMMCFRSSSTYLAFMEAINILLDNPDAKIEDFIKKQDLKEIFLMCPETSEIAKMFDSEYIKDPQDACRNVSMVDPAYKIAKANNSF